MVVRRFLFGVLFSLFFIPALFAIDRVVLFMASDDIDKLIREETLSELAMQDWLAVKIADRFSDNPDELKGLAISRGVDSALLLYMQNDMIVFSVWDFSVKQEIWHYEQELPPVISSPVLARAVVSPIKDKLKELAESVSRQKPKFGEGVLVVSALPGTSLSGIFDEPVVVGDKGLVRLRLPAPSTYVIRAEKDGYRPVELIAALSVNDKTRVDFFQAKVYGLAVSIGAQHIQYPYIGFAYWLIPDKLRLDWDIKWYGIGYYLPSDVYASVSAGFVSFPLIETGLGFSVPFYRFLSDVSLFFFAGFNLRFVYPVGYTGLDPVAPFFTEIGLGADLPLFYAVGKWSFFFESFFTSYISNDRKQIYQSLEGNMDMESSGDIYNAFFVPGTRLGLRMEF
ncbi:carboxypeptidase-like regulatory domain-containing protein [Spirochaetia bacterium 38H-sp]|uniref:Carboxypeptidase-like regulatory domain-containing protein n=1 Tax=Rarispira pelagica TaxID=3141764 RepID=A0ABU9U960_9SPIR